MSLYDKTAHELHELLAAKKISAAELTADIFSRVEETENKIGAYLTLTRDKFLAAKKFSRLKEFLARLKTTSARKEFARLARQKFWKTLSRPTTPRLIKNFSRKIP